MKVTGCQPFSILLVQGRNVLIGADSPMSSMPTRGSRRLRVKALLYRLELLEVEKRAW